MLTTDGVIRRGASALRERSSAWAVGLSLFTVAATTGFISYTHICALTLTQHQSWKTAHLMSLPVDGQIVIGSVYFMEHEGRKRLWGLLGIVPGVLESLYANWESSAYYGWHAAGWATVPAQAFACSTFLFERWLKSRRTRPAGQAEETAEPAAPEEHAAPVSDVPPAPETEPAAPGPAPEPAVQLLRVPPQEEPPAKLPLPEGEELVRVLTELSQNRLASTYEGVSRYRAAQLKQQLKDGLLGAEMSEEDVA